MLSKILDFPVPFKPVIALNSGSNPNISVRLPYDLKPSTIIDLIYILETINCKYLRDFTASKNR